jgi:DNA-binding HxlR family transcriptional regulator
MSPSHTHDPETCHALNDLLARVGDKWTVLVVGALCGGPKRFNELKRTVDGVSQRMLTLTLRGLERDGLVTRTVFPTIPPRVDYALTERGRTLKEPLNALAEWARSNKEVVARSREAFDRKLAKKTAPASDRADRVGGASTGAPASRSPTS